MARVTRAGLVVALLAVGSVAPDLARAQTSDGTDSAAPDGEAAADPAPDAPADAPADAQSAADAQSDGDATEPEADAAGTSEPTDSATTDGSQGGNTLGTTTEPAADQAAEGGEAAAEEEQAAREPFPWRNSFLSWYAGVTPNSFFRDAQLSYDPLVYNYISLTPRWYLDPQLFFALSQSVSYEMTADGSSSSYNHDVQLSDTVVELRRTTPLEGFVFIPAVRLTLPASKASQAAQRYFGAGVSLTAVRVIPEAWSLTIALQGGYRYWFAGSNVPLSMGSSPQRSYQPGVVVRDPDLGGFGANADLGQASGSSTARHIGFAGLTLNVTPFENFNITFQAYYFGSEGHGLAQACTSVDNIPGGAYCEPDDQTHWRHGTSLGLYLAYDIQPWFNLSVGWSNSFNTAPLFADDASLLSPFNPQNQFSLSATFQLDGIYETLAGGTEDDGLTPEQRQRRRQGLAQRGGTGGSM